MARSHGKVLASIWRDEDWRRLSIEAQWLYTLLLSQPRLTLAGTLDSTPGKWTYLSGTATRERVDDALLELRHGRFVVVDDETGELLIRTFTAHDISPNRVNKNLMAGLWGAWGCIESEVLRSIAVHEVTEELWEKVSPQAPPDALQTRRSARLEPKPPPPSRPKVDSRSGPPLTSHLSPVATHRPALKSVVHKDESNPSSRLPLATAVNAGRPKPDPELNAAAVAALRTQLRPTAFPSRSSSTGGP